MNIITFIGLGAAILTTIAFFPQLLKVIKTKHTKDLSIMMLIVQASGNCLWMIYGFFIKDTLVTGANLLTMSMVLVILVYKLKYK